MPALKILIVDDSSTAIMMSKMMLKKLRGALFLTARNGAEAVDKAQAEQPDLILMDVMMPVMDGLEATKRLREIPSTQSIPIIMLTTRAEMDYVEQGFANGCTDYVTKPIDAHELITKVTELIDG